MGKGDKRSKRGKIRIGSFGVNRPKNKGEKTQKHNNKLIINFMNIQENALNELINIANKLGSVDYSYIVELISNSIRFVPITLAKLHKGAMIDRVRMNKGETLFTSESEISYIKDRNVIDNYLTEFGRANKPHESLFYGAIESTQIDMQRATALFESCSLFKDINSVCIEGQLCTVSRWEVLEELIVAEMVFSDEALATNPDIQKSFAFHFDQVKEHPAREIALRQLQFFSNQYARKINTHEDYKISVAFSELLLSKIDVAGIAYPSVASELKGQNIVLKPEIVDKFLKLKVVSTMRVHKNGLKSFVTNHKYVNNINDNNSNFNWIDTDSKDLSNEEEIKHYLGLS